MAGDPPLWRQAYDAVERRVTPPAEQVVRTEAFAVGTALVQRTQRLVRDIARDTSARAWHLLNLPAGSDVERLRAQIGALDREVRRLTVQLENERRRTPPRPAHPTAPEEPRAQRAEPADDPRPRPARRRTQRPAGA
ncbi:hypothetical protein OF117_05135 [Geodermatophilus sp. YIM 151500]|uniref:hypothetical protein n=1 Tax=Geodermatophilus sp. YIM 151500 TaxID=2984531 RepID=UPI0021E47A5A|nr:hypothetical protein [Geodermatophilus sp. YIM 151500]MCV2488739.1 hypothetical protein [Geodermatophilus sp. YIM 151500]